MSCTKDHFGSSMAIEWDDESGMISLTDDWVEAEFRMATRQAVENNEITFMFHGYEIETSTAIDVVQAMSEVRQYH